MNRRCYLVLGCSGQDGSLLCKSLIEKNQKVIGTSRITKNNENLKTLAIENEFEKIELNLLNQKCLKNIILKYKPDYIFNLSAQSSVGRSFNQLSDTFNSISNVTHNILEAARSLNFDGKIFFAGSSEMYGETNKRIKICDIKNPISPYGIAKLHSYQLVNLYRKVYGLHCMTGVFFNHESTLRSDEFVFPKIIKSALNSSVNKNFKCTMGDLRITRDWGWAEEYIEAIQMIAKAKIAKDYLICTGKSHSLQSVVEKAFKYFHLDWRNHVTIDHGLFRPTDILKSCGNPSEIFKDLQWKSKMKIEKIIEKLIEIESKKLLNN